MSRTLRRTVLGFLSLALAFIPVHGCSGEQETTLQPPRSGSLQEEPWFQSALSFLSAIQNELRDPAVRAEVRIHLLAQDDAGAFRRLGLSREDLRAFLARQEILRSNLQQRWPELDEQAQLESLRDPRAELIGGLGANAWQSPAPTSAKEFYTCAIVTFFQEYQRCTLANGDIYATVGCIIDAYWRFLRNLAEGC
jgi:hypothetical protein